jgi:threonine dehydrogenase-like Zn-dependent dehydrogenase
MVRMGCINPLQMPTKIEPLANVIDAHEHFDRRESGWIRTELKFARVAE